MKRSSRLLLAFLGAMTTPSLGCEWIAGIDKLEPPPDTLPTKTAPAPGPGAPSPVVDGGVIVDATVPDGGHTPVVFARRVALGSTHSCAVRANGKVECWGSNASGQLGPGAPPEQAEARPVAGIERAVSIVAGAGHTCALDADGAIRCWGRSAQGQLGGAPTELGGIVLVDTKGEAAVQIASGALHSCALLVKSGVRCWGDNAQGQLGDGSRTPSGAHLVAPANLDQSSAAVFAAGFFTCAVRGNGAIACWGDNSFGQLGDRTYVTRPTPVLVRDLSDPMRELALGQNTACAVAAGGAVSCWGRNRPLGDAATFGVVSPAPDSAPSFTSPAAVGRGELPLLQTIAVSATHACGRTIADRAVCWGSNAKAQLGVEGDAGAPPGFHDVTSIDGAVKEIAVGLTHSCALAANDDIYCWGNNEAAQLGATASGPRAKPLRVATAGH